ncbi:hypothetical protein V8F20_000188 [Naviculisporaceae sp. PSN 640]
MDQCAPGSQENRPDHGLTGKGDNDVQEDPIITAMRRADALDRETESLQPPNYDVDLALKSSRSSRVSTRPRSMSWSVMDFAIQFRESRTGIPLDAGEGYPVIRIQSPIKRKRSRSRTLQSLSPIPFQVNSNRTLLHWVGSVRGSAAENTREYPPTLVGSRPSTKMRMRGYTPTLGSSSRPSWSLNVPIRTSSRDAPTMLNNSLEKSAGDSSQSDDDDGSSKLFTDHNKTPQTANLAVTKPYPPMSPLFERNKIHFGSQVFGEPLQLETDQGGSLASPRTLERSNISVPPLPLPLPLPGHHLINTSTFGPSNPFPPFSLPESPQSLLDDSNSIMDDRSISSLQPQSHSAITSRTFGPAEPNTTTSTTRGGSTIKSKTSSTVTTTEVTMSSEMIIAVGAEDGVSREFLTKTIGQIEALAPKSEGVSQCGRLNMRELIANAMQSFTTLPLVQQMQENPFTNRSLLAQLIVPHIEAYFLTHSQIRLLIIEYPADHLSTILSLQALMGRNSMAVAGILNEDDHALSRCSTPLGNTAKPPPVTKKPSNESLSIESRFQGPPTSFSKANYLVTASATDSEMTAFLAHIRDFYLPEEGQRKERKRRRVKPEEASQQQRGVSINSADSKTSSNRRNFLNLRLEYPHQGFSSSSNLATPPISPIDPTEEAPADRSSFSPSTTTTHLYLQPVSPESLEFGRAGPNSRTIEKLKNPTTMVFKAVSPTEHRRPQTHHDNRRSPSGIDNHHLLDRETPPPRTDSRNAFRRKPLPSTAGSKYTAVTSTTATTTTRRHYNSNDNNNTNTNLILFGDDDDDNKRPTNVSTTSLPSYHTTTASFSSRNIYASYTDSEDDYGSWQYDEYDDDDEDYDKDSLAENFGKYHSSPTTMQVPVSNRCERCGSPNIGRKEEKIGAGSKSERLLGVPAVVLCKEQALRDRKAMKLLGLE